MVVVGNRRMRKRGCTEVVMLCIWVVVAALVESTIFCMHGGLSPDLDSLQQV